MDITYHMGDTLVTHLVDAVNRSMHGECHVGECHVGECHVGEKCKSHHWHGRSTNRRLTGDKSERHLDGSSEVERLSHVISTQQDALVISRRNTVKAEMNAIAMTQRAESAEERLKHFGIYSEMGVGKEGAFRPITEDDNLELQRVGARHYAGYAEALMVPGHAHPSEGFVSGKDACDRSSYDLTSADFTGVSLPGEHACSRNTLYNMREISLAMEHKEIRKIDEQIAFRDKAEMESIHAAKRVHKAGDPSKHKAPYTHWTRGEEDALRAAMQQAGTKNVWSNNMENMKAYLHANNLKWNNRTNKQLSDKWKTLQSISDIHTQTKSQEPQ